jgi:aspartyl protease family protein
MPQPPAAPGVTEVALSRGGGTVRVPVIINDTLRLGCVIDSGASDVVLPADVVMTLLRTGTLRDSDFLGKQISVLADGSKLPSPTFRIRSLRVGDKVLNNVIGSASPAAGEPLLGQSFLSRFKSWSIDNARDVLVLE